MREFDLPCFDGRKSFYGKAKIIELDNGTKQLKSYNTIVGQIDNDKNYVSLWDGKTRTTTRHIKSFKKYYNLEV